MYQISRDWQIIRSSFGNCRSASRYGYTDSAMPLRHAVIACLFIIFCLAIIYMFVRVIVIVVGLPALLAGLLRLLTTNEHINPGTSCA
jgi:hypothetical protein